MSCSNEPEFVSIRNDDTATDQAGTAAGSGLAAQAWGLLTDGASRVASQIAKADYQAMKSGTSSFARDNPVLFVGAASLAGFAAIRFVQGVQGDHKDSEDDPWGVETSREPAFDRGVYDDA